MISGYDPDLVKGQNKEELLCTICTCITRRPHECSICNHLYCEGCIEEWLASKNECPNRCILPGGGRTIRPASKIVEKIINLMDISCTFCECLFKIADIEEHEELCRRPKCESQLC